MATSHLPLVSGALVRMPPSSQDGAAIAAKSPLAVAAAQLSENELCLAVIPAAAAFNARSKAVRT